MFQKPAVGTRFCGNQRVFLGSGGFFPLCTSYENFSRFRQVYDLEELGKGTRPGHGSFEKLVLTFNLTPGSNPLTILHVVTTSFRTKKLSSAIIPRRLVQVNHRRALTRILLYLTPLIGRNHSTRPDGTRG